MRASVFCDIDETLSYKGGPLSPRTIEAIKTLKESGNYFFILTARMLNRIPQNILKLEPDAIVSAAGAYVTQGIRVLFERHISGPLMTRALEYAVGHRIPVAIGTLARTYCLCGYEPFSEVHQVIGSPADFYRITPPPKVYKLSFRCDSNDLREALFKGMEKHLTLIDNEYGSYEAIAPHCDKGTGVRFLMKHFGLPALNSYAFGDSACDIPMLCNVETGIAMGNAKQHVKAAADYITTAFDEDGVYKALKHFGLV